MDVANVAGVTSPFLGIQSRTSFNRVYAYALRNVDWTSQYFAALSRASHNIQPGAPPTHCAVMTVDSDPKPYSRPHGLLPCTPSLCKSRTYSAGGGGATHQDVGSPITGVKLGQGRGALESDLGAASWTLGGAVSRGIFALQGWCGRGRGGARAPGSGFWGVAYRFRSCSCNFVGGNICGGWWA